MDIKKYLPTIIIVGICLVLFLSIYIFQYFIFQKRLQNETTLAYLKGKAETMLEESDKLIVKINDSLQLFKINIDNYNKIVTNIKEVSKNVSEKMQTFSNILNDIDNAYNTLYQFWTNSKRN